MGFGGFLGMGEDHYPVPWSRLKYNEKLGGYEFILTDEQLKNAPHYATGEEWKWDTTQGNTALWVLRRASVLADVTARWSERGVVPPVEAPQP